MKKKISKPKNASRRKTGWVLEPGGGRDYPMGRIRAVFKADGEEVQDRHSISEWWLEAHTAGPGAHSHAEDDLFYVLEGTMPFLLGKKWIQAGKGPFMVAPAASRRTCR